MNRGKLGSSERVGYLFVLPCLLFMLLFIVYPIFYNFTLSFQAVDMMTLTASKKEFIGLANYRNVFSGIYMTDAIRNTFVFTVGCIVFQFTIGFFLAVIYTQKAKKLRSMSGILLVAYIMPGTVTAIMFKFFFQATSGVVNNFLIGFGLMQEPIEWLLTPDMAMWSVIIANTWTGIAFNMILLIAGLVGIPAEMYESAKIDGAGGFKEFFYITVPMMRSSIQTVLVLGFVYTFKCFELIYVMTKGGPVNATELLSIYSYRRSFIEFNFGEGTAIGNVLFLFLLLVGLLYTRLLGRDGEVM